MKREDDQILLEDEMEDSDMEAIRQTFIQEIVPKLKRLDARIGALNCEFAGKKYSHWNIRFESEGEGYNIVDFEYDEEGTGLDLDL